MTDVAPVDPEVLESLRWLAMPVCVVGAAADDQRACATGTLSYVSTRPATIATPLARGSSTYRLAKASGMFSVSLLRDDQVDVAVLAARHHETTDKFCEMGLEVATFFEVPALKDCGTVLWCSLEDEDLVGGYAVCIGTIQKVSTVTVKGRPLLRQGGAYHAMGEALVVSGESPYPL